MFHQSFSCSTHITNFTHVLNILSHVKPIDLDFTLSKVLFTPKCPEVLELWNSFITYFCNFLGKNINHITFFFHNQIPTFCVTHYPLVLMFHTGPSNVSLLKIQKKYPSTQVFFLTFSRLWHVLKHYHFVAFPTFQVRTQLYNTRLHHLLRQFSDSHSRHFLEQFPASYRQFQTMHQHLNAISPVYAKSPYHKLIKFQSILPSDLPDFKN